MSVPTRPRWLLLLSLAYLAVVTFWLGPEDSIWLAAVLGWLGAGLGVSNVVTLRLGGQDFGANRWLIVAALWGLAVGAGAGVVTAALMLMKTAAHAHGPFTDFPLGVMAGILRRVPIWAAAGGLVGLAFGLARLTLRRDES